MVRLSFFYCCGALLTGCVSKQNRTLYENIDQNGKRVIVKKTFDEHAMLIQEERLDKDSVRNGAYWEYKDGKIKCTGHFADNKKDGTWKYFDATGAIQEKESWFNGKRFGEQFHYYNTGGRRLSAYLFDNLEGTELFKALFDSNGKITRSIGAPLYLAYNKADLKVNEELDMIFFFGAPPKCTYKLNISEWSSARHPKCLSSVTVVDSSGEVQRDYMGEKYLLQKTYAEKGVYDWKFDFSVNDGSGRAIVHDTTSQQVLVN